MTISNTRENAEVIEGKFIQSVTDHLRMLSRKVMKVDTKEEILQYLADTFIQELSCDFVAIATIEEGQLTLSSLSGDFDSLANLFPYPVQKANPILFQKSIMSDRDILSKDSPISQFFKRESIDSWFTMPIADEDEPYGLCIVGYHKKIVLYQQMQKLFDEFGNYIGIALNLIKKNELKARNMLDIGWMAGSIDRDNPLNDLIKKVVTFAGRESKSTSASIYLFNEEKDTLIFTEPSYGHLRKKEIIHLDEDNLLQSYFPHVEEVGYNQIAIPLTVDVDLIGVLYVQKSPNHFYTGHDLEQLQMYGNFFSVNYENMQLTLKEKRQNDRLQKILKIQQQFIRKTVENDGFSEINQFLGEMLNSTVILFDRFMNIIDYYLPPQDTLTHDEITAAARQTRQSQNLSQASFMMQITEKRQFEVMAINDGTDLHAFIAIEPKYGENTELLALTINTVNNIYSLQFIKRKIEWGAHEQVKDNFVQNLLMPQIESLEHIMEYASLFNWDVYLPHRIAVVALRDKSLTNDLNLLDRKTELSGIYNYLKQLISNYNPAVITSLIDEQLVVFTPIQNKNPECYWNGLYQHLKNDIDQNNYPLEFVLGVGGQADTPEEYYESYQKALQATNVLLKNPLQSEVAFFDDLGSYTVLNWVKENPSSEVFMRSNLQKLFEASHNQQVDLYDTLKEYLNANGNITATAQALFLHRSTLNYRLDKIREILNVDIDDADVRFNLMLAFRLADLHDNSVFL